MDPVKAAGYNNYSEVPNYRRHKGFWTIYMIIPILAIFILLTGDVFYQRNGQIRAFSDANVILAMLIAALWFGSMSVVIVNFLKGASLG